MYILKASTIFTPFISFFWCSYMLQVIFTGTYGIQLHSLKFQVPFLCYTYSLHWYTKTKKPQFYYFYLSLVSVWKLLNIIVLIYPSNYSILCPFVYFYLNNSSFFFSVKPFRPLCSHVRLILHLLCSVSCSQILRRYYINKKEEKKVNAKWIQLFYINGKSPANAYFRSFRGSSHIIIKLSILEFVFCVLTTSFEFY